jgi:multidrug efflux pump subunit AcrB
MDKFLRSVITIERTFQIFALVGVILLLGYFGLNSLQRDRTPSVPETSSTTQLK